MKTAIKSTISFKEFTVDPFRRVLKKNGEMVSLNSKTFDLLIVLLENAGEVVGKNELLDRVWENQFVEENNLTVHVAALRKAFGEKKGEHRFIVTVPGRGYSFVANICGEKDGYDEGQIIKIEDQNSSSLIGRGREIADIKNLLLEGGIRLLTLTGAGGSGKTTLARAIANALRTNFADGVFFVELSAANTTEVVVSEIAKSLEISEFGEKPPPEVVINFLREKRILLVLDNFEQVLSAAIFVREILSEIPTLKILITSRAALRIPQEREFPVLPLELPPENFEFSPEESAEFSSVALFEKRAGEAKSSFVLNDDNANAVAEICRKLDGLPLAIELAAARVKLLSPQAILERLENSLKLLTGGAKDLPERQRTMRGAIRWSYDLLDADEQILFRRLSVFRGGFTVEAAEFLAEYEDDSSANLQKVSTPVLDLLSSLLDNNLLVSKEQKDGNARLQMLEIVREFAFEVLEETSETENVRRIHAEFFLALAEQAEPLLHGENGKEWHAELETEHDNLRAALSWSLKNAPEIAARIAAAVRFFWLNRSYPAEGLKWINSALEAMDKKFTETRAKLLLANGLFLKKAGNLDEARKIYEEVSEKSIETKDLSLQIKANHGLSAVAIIQNDFKTAKNHVKKALVICREIGDERQTAFSLCALGDVEMSRKNMSAARPLFEECLEISRKIADDRLLMVTLFNLGMTSYFEKRYETAAENFTESLKIAYEMKNTNLISCSLDGIAAIAFVRGKPEQAAFLNGAVDSLNDSQGYKPEPADEIFRQDYIEKTQNTLGENIFKTIYEQGKNLKSEEIIQYVAARRLSGESQNTDEVSYLPDGTIEIVIEKHKFEKIVIDEEI